MRDNASIKPVGPAPTIKTFSSIPVLPASDPTTDNQATRKAFTVNASNLASGTVPTARLGSGTASSSNYLRGDQSWQVITSYTASVKIGSFTRDTILATGDVSYIGIGFQPKYILFKSYGVTSTSQSDGFSDGISHHCMYYWNNQLQAPNTNYCIYLAVVPTDSGSLQHAIVKSMDADGFTLTWTKVGTPSGTATIIYLAYK
jgi:hypothetical protein